MKKNRLYYGSSLLIICSVIYATSLSAQVYPLKENNWKNPDFVNWFTASYAYNGEINPRISSPEQELFKTIAPEMQASPDKAIIAIVDYIKVNEEDKTMPEYSAALDYTLGSLYLQTGAMEKSIEKYKLAIQRFPTFQRAFQNLGLAYVQTENYEKALPLLTKAVELGGGSGTLWGLIGYSYLNTEKTSQALVAYEQALLFQPHSKDWKLGKLNCLINLGDRATAIVMLDEMLRENTEEASLWLQQANAYLGEGKALDAAANLELVGRAGKGNGRTFLLLGDIYLNEGIPNLAMKSYTQALETNSLDTDRLLLVAGNFADRGENKKAEEFLAMIRAQSGIQMEEDQHLKSLNLEARLALINGDKAKAAGILQNITSIDPMNGEALINLGEYYRDEGEIERAILQFERAAKIEEEATRIKALIALGRLEVGQRNYRNALQHLRRAQALDPKPYLADYIAQLDRAIKSM